MSHRRLILLAALVGAAAALARRLVTYEVAESSMTPTLEPGDWLVCVRRPASVRVGSIVVVAHPHRGGFALIKRVTAVAGEVPAPGRLPLGPGWIWIEGDAPHEGSVDSHRLGPIEMSTVKARVIARYHPKPRLLGSTDQPPASALR